ncbi:MAG: hypothetical protein Q9214_007362 [Letrouitia sp. 1 TL-2023]
MTDSSTSSRLDKEDWWEKHHLLSKTWPSGQLRSLATVMNQELPLTDESEYALFPPGTQSVILKWKLRGIWDDEDWKSEGPGNRWKHELKAVPQLPQGANFEQRVDHAREIRELDASRPINMFLDDWLDQIKETVQKKGWECTLESDLIKMIEDTYHFIKGRWARQQIWTEEWKVLPSGVWRHEEVELGPEPRIEGTMTGIDSNASTVTGSELFDF